MRMLSAMSVDTWKIESFDASQSEKMIMLREWFCSYMQEKYPGFYNPEYTTQKLKRIAETFGTEIKFSINIYNTRLLLLLLFSHIVFRKVCFPDEVK